MENPVTLHQILFRTIIFLPVVLFLGWLVYSIRRRGFLWGSFWFLLAFAATAVASIVLQNFIWVAVALFLFQTLRNGKVEWPRGLFMAVTGVFLLSFIAASLWGIDPANSFKTVHKYLTLLLIFFVAAMPLSKADDLGLLKTFQYGAAFCALAGIFKHFYFHQDRIDSFSGDKMVFGGMLMAAVLLETFFLREEPRDGRGWARLALILAALFFTQTRGAWLGALAGFIFLSWRFDRRWILGLVLALGLAIPFIPQPLMERLKSATELHITYDDQHHIQNSSEPRVLIWASGWRIIRDYPWGIGQGNISEVYPRYRLGALDRYEPDVPHLHDNFLQLLLQNGWIGLAVYLFWIFAFYRDGAGFKIVDRSLADLNWTLMGIFTAVLVWGLTEYTFSHQFMNIQCFLLGLQAGLRKKGTVRQSMKR
jgi:O-antigen ligase